MIKLIIIVNSLIEGFLCAKYFYKHLQVLTHSILTIPHEDGIIIIPNLQMNKLRHRSQK